MLFFLNFYNINIINNLYSFTNINYNVVYNNFMRGESFGMNENINYRF